MSNELQRNHCWHEKAIYGHHGVQCCYCGIRWWEGIKIPLVGHGPFSPKEQSLPRPNRLCAGPETKGKCGRASRASDIDFSLIQREVELATPHDNPKEPQ